jgi:dihydrofolate synthase / folylpolyglutamate synthase
MGLEFDPLYYYAVDEIYHADWATAKLVRLELIRKVVRQLWPEGHPTKLIHVAGTSGKGSVTHYLEAGLARVGQVGSLTSPHLYDFRERISIGGQYAARSDIVEAWEQVIRPISVEMAFHQREASLTITDVCILLALVLFAKYNVRWAVIEAGVGGRYDKTNALDTEVAVLTNVGRDHQHSLGSEKWQRALNKAGICRPGKPFFTSARDTETLRFVRAVCDHLRAPLYQVEDADVELVRQTVSEMRADELPPDALLLGRHQLVNAALAAMVIRHIAPEMAMAGVVRLFAQVRFPGRFERIADGVYADIAHNPEKIRALVDQIQAQFPTRRKIFVLGLSGERIATDVFPAVMEIAERVIVTSASYKGRAPEEVASELRRINPRNTPIEVCEDPREALARAQRERGEDGVVCMTGSAYSIDQALNPDPYMRFLNASWGWRYRNHINESRDRLR